MNNQSDMCNGVFAPVCNPQVCDVPRIPYQQDLVNGMGYVRDLMDCCAESFVYFHIHIYRKLEDVFGELKVTDECGRILMHSTKLESYHSPNENSMIADFHISNEKSGKSRELAVFASIASQCEEAKFYMYSAPLFEREIRLGGEVMNGTIEIEKSLVDHNH